MYSKDQKIRILKNYLGPFYERPNLNIRNSLRGVHIFSNLVLKTRYINQAITFLLLKDGRQNYKVISSYEVIDIYLGKVEEVPNYRDLVSSVLIVKTLSYGMENKRKWDLIYQLSIERNQIGKSLIVILEEGPVNEFVSKGFTYIDLDIGDSSIKDLEDF